MKKIIAALLITVFTTVSAIATQTAKPIDISAEELNKMLNDKADVVLIDARYEKNFKKGYIKGAINIPADKVNAETLAKVAEPNSKKLVFYCGDIKCPASRIGAAKAIGAGYKYVYEFPGGYEEWKQKGFATTIPE